MSCKKSLELLKAIGKYMTETEGFDRVLRNVSVHINSSIFSKPSLTS
jgi:hypothetical protein